MQKINLRSGRRESLQARGESGWSVLEVGEGTDG